ncbi:hypothetical protein [Lactiplantibacillus daowaiensis]|uniref:Uncharacterized protein n=1 Tax=Lactiplantibacillus daowaiensis TaxID=2559918 RepID=A0ABW1RWT0_9LACO|nr:hypothetical protein [Lactiplantibacillus daowaiensis]
MQLKNSNRKWHVVRRFIIFGGLLILGLTVALSLALTRTQPVYGGVPITEPQLATLRKVTQSEKRLKTLLATNKPLNMIELEAENLRLIVLKIDGSKLESELLDGNIRGLEFRAATRRRPVMMVDTLSLFKINRRLAEQLGHEPKQVQAVFSQLQLDAGLPDLKVTTLRKPGVNF